MSKSLLVYGFHSIQAQLNTNPQYILKVFICYSRDDKRAEHLLEQLKQHQISVEKKSKQQLDKLTSQGAHQGIAAKILPTPTLGQADLMRHLKTETKPSLTLMIDSVQDPRNLGACLRSANAFGVNRVIINKRNSAPISALVYKACAGAINQLRIFQVVNLVRAIKILQKHNIWVVGLDGSASQSLQKSSLNTSMAIVVGAEGFGLKRLTKDSCDQLVKIPMQGDVESLNVSVATGIALFESRRQQQTNTYCD